MKKVWVLFSMLAVGISCHKKEEDAEKLKGSYIGYFHRNRSDVARISLQFSGKQYQGQSDKSNYPAICQGSFQQNKNSITFHDSCRWTPDVDPTLIVSGTYSLQHNNDGTIRLWRKNTQSIDEFVIVPQMTVSD